MKKLLFLGLLVFSLIQPQVFAQSDASGDASNDAAQAAAKAVAEKAKKDFAPNMGKQIAKDLKAVEKVAPDASSDIVRARLLTEAVMETTKELKGKDSAELNYEIARNLKQETKEEAFLNNFGIAVAFPIYSKYTTDRPPVEVTVEQDSTDPAYDTIKNLKRSPQTPMWMVEIHKDLRKNEDKTFGYGPFGIFGLSSGNSIPFSSAGLGWFLAFKGTGANDKMYLNVGLGGMYDYTAKVVKKEYTSDYYVKEKHKIKHGTELYDTGLIQAIAMISFNLGW